MPIWLIVGLICGVICGIVASTKGRSPVGWFFIGFLIGIFGLIIILVLSNVKEEKARQLSIEQENHRLREQIRQEQIKAEAFRSHAQRRLDTHDEKLGVDTRSDDRLLDGGSVPAVGLLEPGHPPLPTAAASMPVDTEGASKTPGWYYTVDGQTSGPVPSAGLLEMLRINAIPKTALVWIEGMADWTPAERVPEFNALANS